MLPTSTQPNVMQFESVQKNAGPVLHYMSWHRAVMIKRRQRRNVSRQGEL